MKNFYEHYLKPYIEDDLTLLCVIFLFSLFLRLIFLPHLSFDPAVLTPVIDSKEHNTLALRLLNEDHWRITQFWYHTPGYAYFVAFVYKLLGENTIRLAMVQYVLGSSCACLVYYMIKRLMNRWAALFGAFLMSAYWLLIYTQSHVFSENLSMLFNLLMVCLLLFMKEIWHKYLLCGVLLGLSIVVRPEIGPFAGALLVWLIIKKLPLAKIMLYFFLFILGAGLCVLPLLVRHYQLSGEFRIREQIGVNFFMGSMPEYKGSNIYVSVGRKWDKVIRLPFRELNATDEELSQKEIDGFYKQKVLDYIKGHPVEWTKFMAAKAFSVLVGIDFLRSEDVYFYDRYIRHTPFSFIQTWFISILAVIGIGLSLLRDPGRYVLFYVYLAAYLAAMFFTYKTRYLVSHMPLLIVFAAYAFDALLASVKRQDYRFMKRFVSVFLVLYICVRFNPLNIFWPSTSEMHYVIAMNYFFKQDYASAEEQFKTAIEVDPENVDALRHSGIMYMKMGEYKKAILVLQNALAIDPNDQWIASLYNDAIYYYNQGV